MTSGRPGEPFATITHRAAIAALARFGAEVRVFADADNCVRPRADGEAAADGGDAAARPFVIEVQGTPNLFHELAHVVLLGRLAKDHATETARIPFDLTSAASARLLFEELACCLVSCSWHPDDRRAVDAWLDEQVDIQPCFFRRDGDLAAFLRDAAAAVARDPAGFVATCERALVRTRDALAAAGLPPAVVPPHPELRPLAEWRALLDRHGVRAAAE